MCIIDILLKLQLHKLVVVQLNMPQVKKYNPYVLLCYRQDWSATRIAKNNAKYWEFEIENNWQ